MVKLIDITEKLYPVNGESLMNLEMEFQYCKRSKGTI